MSEHRDYRGIERGMDGRAAPPSWGEKVRRAAVDLWAQVRSAFANFSGPGG